MGGMVLPAIFGGGLGALFGGGGTGAAAAKAAADAGGATAGSQLGGLGTLLGLTTLASMFMPSGGQGGRDDSPMPQLATSWNGPAVRFRGYSPVHTGEINYFPAKKKLAEGGLADLQSHGVQSMRGVGKSDDANLIHITVAAMRGQVPNPQAIIAEFVQRFGQDALADLMARVHGSEAPSMGGQVQGPGDGMSDSVPATINGNRPAELSSGEFVVPSDVVSGIGSGSTDAGARRLHAMMNSVRQARHGTKKPPKAVNWKRHRPA